MFINMLEPRVPENMTAEEYVRFSHETGIVLSRQGENVFARDWAYMPFFSPDTYKDEELGSALRGQIFNEAFFYEGFHCPN